MEPLLHFLATEAPGSGVRTLVIDCLGDLKDRRAVQPLLAILDEPAAPADERWAAAAALGKLREPRATARLMALIRDPAIDRDLLLQAIMGLGASGDSDAVTQLLGMLPSADWELAQRVVEALGELKDRRAVAPLCEYLNRPEKSHLIRSTVPEALLKIGDRQAEPCLVGALGDSSSWVRRAAARALTGLGWTPITDREQACLAVAGQNWDGTAKWGAAAVEPLLVALNNSDDFDVALAAAQTLERLRWQPANDAERAAFLVAKLDFGTAAQLGPAAVEPLLRASVRSGRKCDPKVQNARARHALRDIGAAAVGPLIAIFKSKDAHCCPAAAQELTGLDDRRAMAPAVEPLIAALNDASYPDEAALEAVRALGRSADKRAIGPLIALLSNKSPELRARAADSLGELGDPCAVPAIVALLDDGDMSVRDRAVWALGQLAWQPAAADLQDPRTGVRLAAACALAKASDPRALAPLLAALQHESPEIRSRGADGLGDLRDKHSVAALIAALKDRDRRVRGSAAGALGNIGDCSAVMPLIATLDEPDAWVRGAVAEALGRLGDKRAVDPLRAALRNNAGEGYGEMVDALRKLEQDAPVEAAVMAVLDSFGDPDASEYVEMEALGTLSALGPPAVPPLLKGLHNSDVEVRMHVVRILGLLGYESTVEPLIKALGDADGHVARLTAAALCRLDDARAVAPLAAALQEERSSLWREGTRDYESLGTDPIPDLTVGVAAELLPLVSLLQAELRENRQAAAWLLGHRGDRRAVEPLAKALAVASRSDRRDGLGHSEAWLQGRALVRLGSPLGIAAVLKETIDVEADLNKLEGNPDPAAREGPARLYRTMQKETDKTLEMILAIGPAAVEPLIALLKEPSENARASAVRALGRFGDKRALPALEAMKINPAEHLAALVAGAIRAIREKN